jgi:microcystin-dependent protein
MNLIPLVKPQFLDENGNPVSNGKLYSYAAGTSTQLATYSDQAGTTPNANPVILDAGGFADVWISSLSYKFVLKTSADVLIWTKDNVGSAIVENGFTTGDVKPTYKNTADSGWIMLDDKSIGASGSGATGRANTDTLDLYTLLWNNLSNTWVPVSGGRGISAAADFAANKTLTLPRSLGRVFGFSGSGTGLTARSLGQYVGEETHLLISAEMPSHTHTQDPHTHTQNPHSHARNYSTTFAAPSTNPTLGDGNAGSFNTDNTTATNQDTTATNQSTGGDGAHNNMQPTSFLNAMIKL